MNTTRNTAALRTQRTLRQARPLADADPLHGHPRFAGRKRKFLTAVIALAGGISSAGAATFTVNTINDVSGVGQTSLRDAITASNVAGGSNVINFTAGLTGFVNLGSDLPAITTTLTINFSTGANTAVTLGGTGGLVQAGAGITVTNGPGAGGFYTGQTTLQSGTFRPGARGYIANQSPLVMVAGSTLDTVTLASGSSGFTSFASLAGDGSVLLADQLSLDLSGNKQASTSFAGTLTGTGGLTLLGGGGALTLTGVNNTYTGTTSISAGVVVGSSGKPFGPFIAILNAGATNTFAPASAVTMFGDGAVLALNGFNQTIGSLDGFGHVSLGAGKLTMGGDNTSTAFNGSISGTGGLTKTGSGIFSISRNTTPVYDNGVYVLLPAYTGPTLIADGVFKAIEPFSVSPGTNAFAPSSAFTVNAGATLDLNGFEQTIGSLAGAGAVTLGSAKLTTGGDNSSTNFSGMMSGTGGLTKTGSGTLVFSGTNSYSGGTLITLGILRAGATNAFSPVSTHTVSAGTVLDLNDFNQTIGALAGAGSVALGSGTLTTGGNHASTTFSGVASGKGGLTKNGMGTQTFTGANLYTGDTNISAGVLAVNGSIASFNTFVDPGGTLGGTGLVLGQVFNTGIVRPGNSPGTLTIAGNYTQFANGTLQIAVAGAQPGQFSVLAVGGTASLAGTLQVVRESGSTLKGGDRLKILTAVGGVTGVFATTVNPFSTLGIQVIYETNDVLLAFTQTSFAAISGLTPNQTAVARTLDGLLAEPRAAALIAFLNGQPLGSIPFNLDLIAGEDLTSIFHLAKSLANVQSANIQQRLSDIRLEMGAIIPINSVNFSIGGAQRVGRQAPPTEDERWGLWMSGSGEFTHVGSTANAPGFDLDTGGVTAGVDYRFSDKFVAGISIGYMNTHGNLANGGSLDADGGRIGAYATYFDGGFHVDASVSGGPNSYHTRRVTANFAPAIASPGGTEVNLLLATGYDWKKGALTIGPVASFQYTNTQLDGFTETGGLAPLSVIRRNADSSRSAVGFHASYEMKVGSAIVRPEAVVSWQHEFADTSYSLTSTFATLGGNPFTVAGPSTGRDSMLIRAGVNVQWSPRLSTFAYYDGELLRKNYSSNNVSLGVRWRF